MVVLYWNDAVHRNFLAEHSNICNSTSVYAYLFWQTELQSIVFHTDLPSLLFFACVDLIKVTFKEWTHFIHLGHDYDLTNACGTITKTI